MDIHIFLWEEVQETWTIEEGGEAGLFFPIFVDVIKVQPTLQLIILNYLYYKSWAIKFNQKIIPVVKSIIKQHKLLYISHILAEIVSCFYGKCYASHFHHLIFVFDMLLLSIIHPIF